MMSEPGRDPFVFTLAIKPRPDLLREIRELIDFAFEGWGLNSAVPVLLTNELATNAMRAAPQAQSIVVRTYVGERGIPVIEVWDEAPEMPLPQDPGPFDEDGRGLLMIDLLSARWGVRPVNHEGKRKVVWVEPVPEPA